MRFSISPSEELSLLQLLLDGLPIPYTIDLTNLADHNDETFIQEVRNHMIPLWNANP